MDKTLGLGPDIRFYEIEDDEKTEEGEEAEILVIHDSSLAASKKNTKRDSPYINIFDYKITSMIHKMKNLSAGVFKNL